MFSQKVKKNTKQFHQSVQWKSSVVCLMFLLQFVITLSVFGQGNWEDNPKNPKAWTNGFVGIGTSKPQSKLHIAGGDVTIDNRRAIFFRTRAGLIDGTGIVRFIGNALRFRYAGNLAIFDALTNHPFQIRNASDVPVFSVDPDGDAFFTNSGNLGIGTTNPGEKLEVRGNNNTTGLRVAWGNQFPTLYGEFKHAGPGGLQINANANGGWADMSLQTDGTTRLFIRDNGNVGIGTNNPSANLQVDGTDGVLFTGIFNSGTIPVEGTGTRMMWYPAKAAFRAGYVSGTGWDDTYVGAHSTAMGFNTIANGPYSVAIGYGTRASGTASTAMGLKSNAESYNSVAIGRYNVGGGNPTSWIDSDPLFEIGIGNAGLPFDNRANALTVLKNGKVGIGTATPQSELAVNGKITCAEVEVTLNGWSDFVFDNNYDLMPLEAVEQHIKQNKHLPDIPSENEVLENGLDLGNMQAKLLQKVEELTLYVIAQNKELKALKELKSENEMLKKRLSSLEQ
jgi:hypothetical protein